MKYDPKNAATKCLPAGEYPASIYGVTDTDRDGNKLVSKKGEDKERVTFEVYHNGAVRYVNQDFTAVSMLFLYQKLAKALGQGEAFKAGQFEAGNHIGDNLVLAIEIEESEQYGDKNVIKAFKPKQEGAAAPQPAAPQRVQAPRPEIPRQQTAPKPRAAEHPLATAREMDPNDVPFAPGDHLFN